MRRTSEDISGTSPNLEIRRGMISCWKVERLQFIHSAHCVILLNDVVPQTIQDISHMLLSQLLFLNI